MMLGRVCVWKQQRPGIFPEPLAVNLLGLD
jgi:hypothetical protein